jgi:hypothetical protein
MLDDPEWNCITFAPIFVIFWARLLNFALLYVQTFDIP